MYPKSRWTPPIRLSVSSVGSEAMQLLFRAPIPWNCSTFSILGRIGGDATKRGQHCHPKLTGPFSILGRIGGDATPGARRGDTGPHGLSVSSVGSEAMQPERRRYGRGS